MKYIAIIHKEEDSDYGVSFPDFPGCVTVGETEGEAIAHASEVLALHIEGMKEDGEKIPEPSLAENIVSDSDFSTGRPFYVEYPQLLNNDSKFL